MKLEDELKSGIYMDCVIRKLKVPLSDEKDAKLKQFCKDPDVGGGGGEWW